MQSVGPRYAHVAYTDCMHASLQDPGRISEILYPLELIVFNEKTDVIQSMPPPGPKQDRTHARRREGLHVRRGARGEGWTLCVIEQVVVSVIYVLQIRCYDQNQCLFSMTAPPRELLLRTMSLTNIKIRRFFIPQVEHRQVFCRQLLPRLTAGPTHRSVADIASGSLPRLSHADTFLLIRAEMFSVSDLKE